MVTECLNRKRWFAFDKGWGVLANALSQSMFPLILVPRARATKLVSLQHLRMAKILFRVRAHQTHYWPRAHQIQQKPSSEGTDCASVNVND